jgi:hypothetical protein
MADNEAVAKRRRGDVRFGRNPAAVIANLIGRLD